MPLDYDGAAKAFRIASLDECESLYSGTASVQTGRAWPVTAAAWLKLHQGDLAAHAAPHNNLAWWLSLQEAQEGQDVKAQKAHALVFVPPSLPCFAGHFLGQPLLPGVIQLQWALSLIHI